MNICCLNFVLIYEFRNCDNELYNSKSCIQSCTMFQKCNLMRKINRILITMRCIFLHPENNAIERKKYVNNKTSFVCWFDSDEGNAFHFTRVRRESNEGKFNFIIITVIINTWMLHRKISNSFWQITIFIQET